MPSPKLHTTPDSLHHIRVGIGSVLLTFAIYLTLPFTQFLAKELEPTVQVTPVDYVEPPLKPISEDISPIEDPLPAPPPPKLDIPPPEKPSLASLKIDLNLGPSYAAPGFNLSNFGVAPDANNDFVFELADLDNTPRCIRRGRLIYPNELKRFELSGVVRLVVLIRKDGTVKVDEVQKSDHPSFTQAAIQAAETSLYETPLRNGEPVDVRFFLPVKFEYQ